VFALRNPFLVLLLLAAALAHAQDEATAPDQPAAAQEPAAEAQPQPADSGLPPAPGVLLDRIVAVVNDGVVLQSELDMHVQQIDQRMRERGVPPLPRQQIQEQVLERLIILEIQTQRAKRLGITVDDDSLNRTLTQLAQRNGIAFEDLPRALASEGIDYQEFREQTRRDMMVEQLRARDVLSRISIAPTEIDAYLRRSIGRDESLEYRLSHILIATPPGASNEQVEDARRRAAELAERARNGEDFSRLAVAYSAASTALQGGDLGWRKVSAIPTLFVDVVTRMVPGDVSDPIPSPSGFHLVRLDETRGADRVVVTQRHVRHILVAPNEVRTDEQAHDIIADLRRRIEAGEDFAVLAREYSEDHASASSGGDLGWSPPGAFTGAFEDALNVLTPGQLSFPVRTEFGWHLIQLLETREHDDTEEQRRNIALQELRRQKAEVENERWERQLRAEAYVEIRL
jgi:peptidyl-prolyl cis-trans isomerase SurA